jgi:hypothetical protein
MQGKAPSPLNEGRTLAMKAKKKGSQHPKKDWLPYVNLVVNLVRLFDDWLK